MSATSPREFHLDTANPWPKDQRAEQGLPAPLVSVIVPVFNAESCLPATVASILSQTYQSLEVLLVDDGSTDESPRLCDESAEYDARVRSLHSPNQGAAAARRLGVRQARGDMVAFVDADDLLDPNMIETLVRVLSQSGADLAVSGHRERRADGRMAVPPLAEVPEVIDGTTALRHLLLGSWMALWGKVIRRRMLDDVHWPGLRVADDLVINAQLFGRAQHVAVVKDQLYTYVESVGGLTRKPLSPEKFQWLDAVDWVSTYIAHHHVALHDEAYFQAFTARFSLLHRALLADPHRYSDEIRTLQARLRADRFRTMRNSHIPATRKAASELMAILGPGYPPVFRSLRSLVQPLRRR